MRCYRLPPARHYRTCCRPRPSRFLCPAACSPLSSACGSVCGWKHWCCTCPRPWGRCLFLSMRSWAADASGRTQTGRHLPLGLGSPEFLRQIPGRRLQIETEPPIKTQTRAICVSLLFPVQPTFEVGKKKELVLRKIHHVLSCALLQQADNSRGLSPFLVGWIVYLCWSFTTCPRAILPSIEKPLSYIFVFNFYPSVLHLKTGQH